MRVEIAVVLAAGALVACGGSDNQNDTGSGGSAGATGSAGSGGSSAAGGTAGAGTGGTSGAGGISSGGSAGASTGGSAGMSSGGSPATGGSAGTSSGGSAGMGTGGSAGMSSGGSAGMGGAVGGRCAPTVLTEPFGPGCTPGPQDVRIVAKQNQFNGSAMIFDAADGTFVRNFFDQLIFTPDQVEQAILDGCVYGTGGNEMVQFDTNASFLDTLVPGLVGARGFDEHQGNFFVSQFFTGAIRRFDADGNPVGTDPFIDWTGANPSDVEVLADGSIVSGDVVAPEVLHFPSGGGTPTALNFSFIQPEQITMFSTGNLFIADYGASSILEFDGSNLTGPPINTFSVPGLSPIGVEELLDGNFLFTADGQTESGVFVFDTSTGMPQNVMAGDGYRFIGKGCL